MTRENNKRLKNDKDAAKQLSAGVAGFDQLLYEIVKDIKRQKQKRNSGGKKDDTG